MTLDLNEVSADDATCQARHGRDAVDHLDQLGVLGPGFLAVHGVLLRADELNLFAERGAALSHNPVSNLFFGHPLAPLTGALRAGIRVGLGTDSAASNNSLDMFETVKITVLVHALANGRPSPVEPARALQLATSGGAATVGLGGMVGQLKVGSLADLVVYNPLHTRSTPVHDVHATLALSAGQEGVETVIVGGRVLLRNGKFVFVDEEETLREVQRRAVALAERVGFNSRTRPTWVQLDGQFNR